MRRIAVPLVCLSLALLVLGNACSDSGEKGPTATAGSPSASGGGAPVTVGALLPLTGAIERTTRNVMMRPMATAAPTTPYEIRVAAMLLASIRARDA